MQRLPTTSTTTTDTGLEIAKWLGGAAAGALLMYMLDPDRGSARRAQSAAAVRNASSRTSSAIGNVWHGAGNRMGAAADDAIEAATPDGGLGSAISTTVSKVRDTMSRAASAAGDVADDAISKAKSGMSRVEDSDTYSNARSAISHAADSAADFYADTRKSAGRLGRRVAQEVHGDSEGAWGPTMRNSALLGGGLLALTGLMRRSPMGLVLGLAGAALLARSAANQPLRSLVGRGAAGIGMSKGMMRGMSMDQTIDFEKTIHIDAAPDEVYDLWANYENFPALHVARDRSARPRPPPLALDREGPGRHPVRMEFRADRAEQAASPGLAQRSRRRDSAERLDPVRAPPRRHPGHRAHVLQRRRPAPSATAWPCCSAPIRRPRWTTTWRA
jgi:hypothetical protein